MVSYVSTGGTTSVSETTFASTKTLGPKLSPTTTVTWHPFSLSRFNSCLSSAGIAWWAVAMVARVGYAAGVTTAGLAFMACVVGTLGVGSGTTAYCFGDATYW